jgi:hypothetical protein
MNLKFNVNIPEQTSSVQIVVNLSSKPLRNEISVNFPASNSSISETIENQVLIIMKVQ